MKENPAYELKRLRALVDWYKRDTEERMTYFMHDREQFEKRVFELTTERDALKRALEAISARDVNIENKDGKAIVHLMPSCQRVTASSN